MSDWYAALVAIAGWAFVGWAALDNWQQVKKVRAWAHANGLPLTPPVSSMRLARAIEALQPSMSGMWDGLWVYVWTRPMWSMTPGRSVYRMKIRVVADDELTVSVQAPALLGHVTVGGRELHAAPWGSVSLDSFPEYLSAAVAHARERTARR